MPISAEQLKDVQSFFNASYDGASPLIITAAPGRVNLIGEHTDYQEGFVMPMALELYTVVAATPRKDNVCNIASRGKGGLVWKTSFVADDELKPTMSDNWSNYVSGVVAMYREALKADGLPADIGFDAAVVSNVPMGAGLSSSASLEVAVAVLVEKITGAPFDGVKRALLCQKAEHLFAGVPCGIMDQFIASLAQEGHALLIDCRTKVPTAVPMKDPSLKVLIADCKVKHSLVDGQYKARVHACKEAVSAFPGSHALRDITLQDLLDTHDLGEETFRRARHVITENRRCIEASRALGEREYGTVGKLMYESHESLDKDFEVTIPALNTLVNIVKRRSIEGDAYGARMTGGGFGGCIVALAHADKVEKVSKAIVGEYSRETGIQTEVLVSSPGEGAHVVLDRTGARTPLAWAALAYFAVVGSVMLSKRL